MRYYLLLLIAFSIIGGCADNQKQERWPDGYVYKTVERFQLILNPKRYHSRNIIIYGYLRYDPSEGYRLYTEQENFLSNHPYMAIHLENIENVEQYYGCYGRYVFAKGKFIWDQKYNILTMPNPSIEGVTNVPPIGKLPIDPYETNNSIDNIDIPYKCKDVDTGARPWMLDNGGEQ